VRRAEHSRSSAPSRGKHAALVQMSASLETKSEPKMPSLTLRRLFEATPGCSQGLLASRQLASVFSFSSTTVATAQQGMDLMRYSNMQGMATSKHFASTTDQE